jgi:hypothetical protein
MMPDFRDYRTGRSAHDIPDLCAAPGLLNVAAIAPPAILDRSAIDPGARMFNNDTDPDCTAAAIGNIILAAGALNGFEPVVVDDRIPAFYAACAGVANTSAAIMATDGVRLLSALQRAAHQGIDVGQQWSLYPFVGTVPCSRLAIAHTTDRFVCANLGIRLYERDEEAAGVLDADGSDAGAMVGRHSLLTFDYTGLGDTDRVRLITYGTLWTVTWRWIAARIDEAHGLYFPQLMPAAESAVDQARLAEARGTLRD